MRFVKTLGKISSNVQMMMGHVKAANSKTILGQGGASAMVVYIRSCIHIHADPNRQ
jgi:hypothetical protein